MKSVFVLVVALFAGPALAQETGADLFADRCAMCHVPVGKGQGPSLKGVVGRKAGSAPGFNYTPAIKASGVVWSQANLERFLTNPQAMIPGTAMPIRVNDASQRAAIVHYLAGLK